MTIDRRSVVGAFPTFSDAQRAADHLFQEGFSRIRVARNDLEETGDEVSASEPKKSGIAGFFSRLFDIEDDRPTWNLKSESEAYFQAKYHSRHHLVVVEKCADPSRCRDIMVSMGGSIEEQGSHYYESELQRNYGATAEEISASDKVMELRAEIPDVQVERVQTGELRIRKDVITEIKTVEVPITREEIVVESRPVEQGEQHSQLEGTSLAADKIQEIRIPISEEQIHIQKTVIPREEIRVSKESITETERFSIDVSHEQVRLESEGKVKIKPDPLERARKSSRDQSTDNHPPA